jgi:site-specific DNA-methyltransferase (adenine-specific)
MIKILQGNCIDKIKELDDNSIDCVVSSPPYFGLRDYGVDGQFGLEKTYHDYLANTVKVFETFKPKLKDTATIWWNVGDSYHNYRPTNNKQGMYKKPDYPKQSIAGNRQDLPKHSLKRNQRYQEIKEKDLMMIPNRVAIALQDAGWYIRSEIIWHKPNPMPESVKDRPTSAHEKIWLITKSKKYYYDADAIREPLASSSLTRLNQPNLKNQKGSTRANGGMKLNGNMKAAWGKYKSNENEKKHRQGMSKTRGTKLIETRPKLPSQKEFVNYLRNKTTLKDLVENTNIKKTTIEHWFRNDEVGFAFPSVEDWNKIKDSINDWTDEFNNIDYGLTYTETHLDEIKNNPIGRNKRNVWTITTKPFKDAHFATFPKDLIEPCIKAGCPEGGVVLDPFGGSGTTGIVAALNNRNAILIELNQNYIDIANKRIDKEVGLFSG